MRKEIISLSLCMILSGASVFSAQQGFAQSLVPTIYDVEGGGASGNQDQGVAHLRSRIAALQAENEQLRNSMARLRNMPPDMTESQFPDSRVQSLLEENKRLTQLLMQQRSNQNSNAPVNAPADPGYSKKLADMKVENQGLQDIISDLKQKNSGLLQRQEALTAFAKSGDTSQVAALQKTIDDLQAENRKLGQALAEASERAIGCRDHQSALGDVEVQYVKQIDALKLSVSNLKAENNNLSDQVKKQECRVENNEDLETLKQQNMSLRETIRAQNDVLKSSDNSSTVAETLMQENIMLKRQLEQTAKAVHSNDQSAQDILKQYAILQQKMAEQEAYIQQLEGLKETVKQLRIENDRHLMGQKSNAVQMHSQMGVDTPPAVPVSQVIKPEDLLKQNLKPLAQGQ